MERVFISHSSKDVDFIYSKVKAVLDEAGYHTWCSATDVRLAADWEQQIREALTQADWFLVVLSPDAVKSPWVQAETHWALEHMSGRVIPIMARTCQPIDVHLRLGTLQYIDFRADVAGGQRVLLALMHGFGRSIDSCPPSIDRSGFNPAGEQATIISRRPHTVVRLRIEPKEGPARDVVLEIDNWAVLGRGANVDLRLADDCISRRHARIGVIPGHQGTRLMLADLESANGTLLNGEGIAAECTLSPGDRIDLGNTRIWVLSIAEPDATGRISQD
jgi:hypothetical protein